MPRPSKPYFWKARKAWYCTIHGKRIRLAEGEDAGAEARRAFHRLMAGEGRRPTGQDLSAAEVFDLFLGSLARHGSKGNFEQARYKFQSFADRFGRRRVSDLRPSAVQDWLADKDWSDSTKRQAITYLKNALNWAVREGLIDENPFASVRRPRMGRRERTVRPEEDRAIRARSDDCFGDLLEALRLSGSRPGEMAALEARHIDWEGAVAVLDGKTTSATGEPIIIILTSPLESLLRRLAERYPEGPLFRNSRGRPWTRNAIRCRMRSMRKALGIEGVTAYTYRHTYVTDALERGVPVADVAALVNHRDIRTTMGYAHLKDRREHLRRQAEKATGD